MTDSKIKKTLKSDEITAYVEKHYNASYVNQAELDRLIEFINYFKLSDPNDIDCIFNALEECHYFYDLAYRLKDYKKAMDYLHYYYECSLDIDSDSDMSEYLEYLLELMEVDSCVCKAFVELVSENPNPNLKSEIIDMVEFHLVEGYRIYVYRADLRKHLYILP